MTSLSTAVFTFFLVAHLRFIRCEKPNIVIIIADDLGWNDIGFHSGDVYTPNIDALAYHGVIFNRHYAQPVCSPSRTALLTGDYPLRHAAAGGGWMYHVHNIIVAVCGAYSIYSSGNDFDQIVLTSLRMQTKPCVPGCPDGLPNDVKTMPQYFSKLGYKSHLVGKWHLGYETPEKLPTRRGFDSFFGYLNGFLGYWDCTHSFLGTVGRDIRRNEEGVWRECYGKYLTDLLTEEAVKVIREHEEPDGLLLILAQAAAHTTGLDIEREAPHGVKNATGRGYLRAMVERMDWSVGEVVSALKEKGILDNTIIIFISDNGAPTNVTMYTNHGSNWPLRGEKESVHDGGVRTVAAMYSPLLKNLSRVTDQYFHITDWLPTLYAAAGGNVEDLDSMDGINQWDSLMESTRGARDTILVNIDEITNTEAVIKNNWKLIKHNSPYKLTINEDLYYGESGRWMQYDAEAVKGSAVTRALGPIPEDYESLRQAASLNMACTDEEAAMAENCHRDYCLFDILKDPTECYNLAANYSDIVAELKEIIESYRPDLVPAQPKYFDLRASPAYWDDYWSPWLY